MGHRAGFPLVGTSPGGPGPGERVSVEIVQDKSWDGGGDIVEPKQAFWQGMKVPANVRKADGAGGVHTEHLCLVEVVGWAGLMGKSPWEVVVVAVPEASPVSYSLLIVIPHTSTYGGGPKDYINP